MEVVRTFAEMEWGRCGLVNDEDELSYPPFSAWRYQQCHPELE